MTAADGHIQLLDARHGPVDHACRGSWRFVGINAGGHDVFACDSGREVLLDRHYDAGHECGPQCDSPTPGEEVTS